MVERGAEQRSGIIEINFRNFKESEGFTHVIGIIGGSSVENIPYYHNLITSQLAIVKQQLGIFAITSGGTQGGVPEMALDIGYELGLPTIGVFPEAKCKYSVPDKTSFSIAVPSHPMTEVTWGIETPVLIGIPDAFLLVGGAWGSLTEVSMIMKRNESLLRHGHRAVPIVSITPDSGISRAIDMLNVSLDVPEGVYIPVNNERSISEILLTSL